MFWAGKRTGIMTGTARTYLDHNATSPLRPVAREAMLAALDVLGNPSSVHAEGRAVRALVEAARAKIAAGLGTSARNVVFTSGATEAANLVLTPWLQLDREERPFDHLFVSAGEHLAVLSGNRFGRESVETVPLTGGGTLSLPALADALERRKGARVILALQAANNETGVIQPVREAAELAHAAGGLLICDATQAVGRIETTFQTMGADALFFSSHKLGGPGGAGALALASDRLHIRRALIRGGGQEGGRRGGTENLAAISGFAAAFEEATGSIAQEMERLISLRDFIERKVAATAPEAILLGAAGPRLPNTSAFVLPGLKAQTVVMALDLEGVSVSSGSACSSGKVRASHVLEAMGLKDRDALRISLGWSSTQEDVELFGIAFARVVERIRLRQTAA
jgi:cysteine desulfurase